MHAITHVILSVALSYMTGLPLVWVVIGGVFPDIDLLFPEFLSHRVELHSLFIIGIISLVLWKLFNKKAGMGFLLGGTFHVIADLMTYYGVGVFWPFYSKYFAFDLADTVYLDIATILISSFLIINHVKIKETIDSIKKFNYYFISGIAIFFIAVAVFAMPKPIGCPAFPTPLSELLAMNQSYSERYVMLNGTVCSEITRQYYPKSDNTYQIFDICDRNETIAVWKNLDISPSEFKQNDLVYVCGVFTLKYDKPEIYMVRSFGLITEN
ncbi:MAG: metal-dependent hydrolase [Candidatus Nanoarchaeia archaeon]|nr:metal-dependent hydrolase [Candidatus Nanoarchaeia archaeon]